MRLIARHSPAPNSNSVAELQGLYGPFSFPERLLQQIWQRGDFDSANACTSDARPVKIRFAGRWNHLGGPDFIGARLQLDQRELTGDVELHLNAKDWDAHGHAADPAYANVILHVVLFPCATTYTYGVAGQRIPILSLLSRLYHGLEEYATDAAIEQLAGRPLHLALENLGNLSTEALDTLLSAQAERRWASKVYFARLRIARLGWAEACHHAALEILGYRFNRPCMLKVAATHPLAEWVQGQVQPEAVFAEHSGNWSLQGVRPLNHPRRRLQQYAVWCLRRPNWVTQLREGTTFPVLMRLPPPAPPRDWRRQMGLTAIREGLRADLCANEISGSRFDNLVADGFMPLLAAETGMDLAAAWAGWFAGDAPESLAQALKALGVFGGRGRPVAMGPLQGLLGWMLDQERLARNDKQPLDGRGT